MSRDASPDPILHRRRRQALLDALGDGLLLLPTANEASRNGDVHFEYRPGSDFHYLTGFPEPDAILAAWRTGKGKHRSVLFVRPRDPAREIWDGKRFGTAGAQARFGVDEAREFGAFWKDLPELLGPHGTLFHRLTVDATFDRRLLEACRAVAFQKRRRQPPLHPTITDPGPALATLRLRKDPAELAAMRCAADVTVAGHVAAMRAARPGMYEYEAQAVLEAEFRRLGSPRNGYPSIVASGANACVLHYHDNDRRMKDGDLLLIDAGAEMGGSTADITRTFPISGRFSAPQKAVYEIVLKAQLAGIAACKAGARWDAAHLACQKRLTKGLVELGVLRGDAAALFTKGAFKKWYMHGTSHWLGRDVHDVGAYENHDGKPEPMPIGAVLTVEPGLYFDAKDKSVPKELRGIGVRIEDDVLITAKGPEVLTAAAPKTVAELEAICGGR